MAWIKAMGGGAPAKFKIYDNGTWNVPYDNPGTWTGQTLIGANINPSSVSVTSTASTGALIGTSNPVDLSAYTMVKIKAHNSGQATPSIIVTDAKSVDAAHILARNVMPLNSDFTEYVVDVTNISTGYIAVHSSSNYVRTCEFIEITLE